MYYDTDKVMALLYNYTTAGNTIQGVKCEGQFSPSWQVLIGQYHQAVQ